MSYPGDARPARDRVVAGASGQNGFRCWVCCGRNANMHDCIEALQCPRSHEPRETLQRERPEQLGCHAIGDGLGHELAKRRC